MTHSPDLTAAAIKMILVFGILLVILVFALHFARSILNRKSTVTKGKLVRVLSDSYVGVKKRIALVEVPGSVLVLGITNDHISLLDKIDRREIIDEIGVAEDPSAGWSFSDQFQKIASRYKRQKEL